MRGVTPGAEPDAGSDENAESPSPDLDQAATSAAGPADTGAQRQAGPAGSAASPEDANGPATGEVPAGSGTAGRKPVVRRSRGARFLRELVILIVIALVIAVVIKTYAIQAFFIPSGSMENTLEINDRVLVNKIVYDTRSIHRGDIVVFNGDGSWDPGEPLPANSNFAEKFVSGFASMFGFGHPGDILIKRVIGLPGDTVACCDAEGRVTVNGIPLNEQSYLYPGAAPSQDRFNIVVPAGRLWVMGDNRAISDDSRDHEGDPGDGTVPENAVIGRAFVIIWPPSRWRILPIPATFEQPALNKQAVSAGNASRTDQALSDQLLTGVRLQPAGPALPLSLGFVGAVPLTWVQYRLRGRLRGSFRDRIRREEGESP
jgi:signal peptidase I